MVNSNFTPKEAILLDSFKKKHPEYENTDNRQLLSGIYKKWPQYSQQANQPVAVENFLQRAIRSASATFAAGGSPLLGMTAGANIPVPGTVKNVEEGLPTGLQIAGSTLGGLSGTPVGHPYQGSLYGGTAGRTIGEIGKQAIQSIIRGKPYDPETSGRGISKAAIEGFGSEALGNVLGYGANKVLFSEPFKQFGKKLSGELIGSAKKAMSKIKVNPDDFLNPISDAVRNLKSSFTRNPEILNDLSKIEDDFIEHYAKTGEFGVEDAFNLRGRLDDLSSKYGIFATQARKRSGRINPLGAKPAKAFNEVEEVLGARSAINDKLGEIAESAGVGNIFQKGSEAYGKYSRHRGITSIWPLNIPGQIVNEILSPWGRTASFHTAKGIGHILPAAAAEIADRKTRYQN